MYILLKLILLEDLKLVIADNAILKMLLQVNRLVIIKEVGLFVLDINLFFNQTTLTKITLVTSESIGW